MFTGTRGRQLASRFITLDTAAEQQNRPSPPRQAATAGKRAGP
jgi:hypothetical protein